MMLCLPLPDDFGMVFVGIEFPCQDEKVVAETVDVGDDQRVDGGAFFA